MIIGLKRGRIKAYSRIYLGYSKKYLEGILDLKILGLNIKLIRPKIKISDKPNLAWVVIF